MIKRLDVPLGFYFRPHYISTKKVVLMRRRTTLVAFRVARFGNLNFVLLSLLLAFEIAKLAKDSSEPFQAFSANSQFVNYVHS